MFARPRHVAVVLFVAFAFVSTLSSGVTSAHALQATGPTTRLVCGVVTSVGSRVVPGSGVIVTDVQVAGSPLTGGEGASAFTMEGGQVGGTGMWTEDYALNIPTKRTLVESFGGNPRTFTITPFSMVAKCEFSFCDHI